MGTFNRNWMQQLSESYIDLNEANYGLGGRGAKLVHTHAGNGPLSAKIYKLPDTKEFAVHFFKNGEHMGEDSVHYTDDLNDAKGTIELVIKSLKESEYDPALMGALGTVAGLGVAAAGYGVKRFLDKRKAKRQAEANLLSQQQQQAAAQAAAQAEAEAAATRAARAKPKTPQEIIARAQSKAGTARTPEKAKEIMAGAEEKARAFVETQRRGAMVPGEGHATIPFTPIEMTKGQISAIASHGLSQRNGLIELVSRIPENHPNRKIFMDKIEQAWPDHPQHGYLPHSYYTSLQMRDAIERHMMERIRAEHPELLQESILTRKYGRSSEMLEILEMFGKGMFDLDYALASRHESVRRAASKLIDPNK